MREKTRLLAMALLLATVSALALPAEARKVNSVTSDGRKVVFPKGHKCPPIWSEFGDTRDLSGDKRRRHEHWGIDIVAPKGTPVYAAADGEVIAANTYRPAGKQVVLKHEYADGAWHLFSYYLHLSRHAVRGGQEVKRGDLIGYLGNTGINMPRNRRAHLHFEVRRADHYTVKTIGKDKGMVNFGVTFVIKNPHDHWYESKTSNPVTIPVFDKTVEYSKEPFGFTYPVPCKKR